MIESATDVKDSNEVEVVMTPAHLHGGKGRFSAAETDKGPLMVREWHSKAADGAIWGFTLQEADNV
jgi:hypothetical protein